MESAIPDHLQDRAHPAHPLRRRLYAAVSCLRCEA